MDDRQFDRIVRLVAAASSRRRLLRSLVGSIAAGGALHASTALDGEARRTEKCPRRCSGRKACCKGRECCNGRCVTTRWNRKHCGACGNRCARDQVCNSGTCGCGNAACGDVCCDFEEACLEASAGTCGACPVGAGIDNPANEMACGATFGEFTECSCVTSVNNVATCSGVYGFCVDCESDTQCTLAMGTQAVCIPVGDACNRYNVQRACVEATCFGGPIPVSDRRASIPGAGPYMRLRPSGRDR